MLTKLLPGYLHTKAVHYLFTMFFNLKGLNFTKLSPWEADSIVKNFVKIYCLGYTDIVL